MLFVGKRSIAIVYIHQFRLFPIASVPFDPACRRRSARCAGAYATRCLVVGLACLAVSFCGSQNSLAQAWTMPRGEHFVKITGSYSTATDQYTFDGRTADFVNGVEGDAFRDESLYLYGEFGFFDHLTLVLSVPYKRLFVRDLAFRYHTYAMGNGMLGVRVALLPLLGARASAVSAALNLSVSIPMGYTRNYAPSAGAGQIDGQATIGVGLSFYPTAAYAQIGGGYRYRSSIYTFSRTTSCNVGNDIDCIRDQTPEYGDEFVFSAEAGIMFINGMLFFQALANGIWSVERPAVGFTAINPIPTLQRFIKVGGGFTVYPFRITRRYGLADLGLSIQYFLTPYGRNTIVSRDLFAGIEYRIR